MVSALASGGFAVLLIGTEIKEPITNAMMVQLLYAAQAALGLRSHLEIAAIHRPAPEIGDPEDILVHLRNADGASSLLAAPPEGAGSPAPLPSR